jgi:hypothetical protein
LYDHAGFIVMRAMMDDNFMDINHDRISSPRLRKVAALYNEKNDLLQDKVINTLSETYANGNLGPKPDLKKPLLNLGGLVINNIGRISIGQTAILALSVGTVTVIALLAAQTGGNPGSLLPEALSTYLGVKPNSSPQPTIENG